MSPLLNTIDSCLFVDTHPHAQTSRHDKRCTEATRHSLDSRGARESNDKSDRPKTLINSSLFASVGQSLKIAEKILLFDMLVSL